VIFARSAGMRSRKNWVYKGDAVLDPAKMKYSNCLAFIIGSGLTRSPRLASLHPSPWIPPSRLLSEKRGDLSLENSVSSWLLILRFWGSSNLGHAFSRSTPGMKVVNKRQELPNCIKPCGFGVGKLSRRSCSYKRERYSVTTRLMHSRRALRFWLVNSRAYQRGFHCF